MEYKAITKFADAWKEYGTKHDWFHAKKKPMPVKVIQMDKDFKVETLEGMSLAGKKGDYLIEGIKGEVYPCNKIVFEESYNRIR